MRPEDVGVRVGDEHRRVAGLRRDEVAIRAGISTEYYLRLEQGRESHPSDQVLDALARALLLDEVAGAYLHAACGAAFSRAGGRPGRGARRCAVAHRLVAAHGGRRPQQTPRRAGNQCARPGSHPDVPGGCEQPARPADRPARTNAAPGLGQSEREVGRPPSVDVRSTERRFRLRALVAELSARSTRFRELWERNDVVQVSDGTHVLRHPEVGRLTLHFARLPLTGTDGQSIFLYHAEPDTPTAEALATLAARG